MPLPDDTLGRWWMELAGANPAFVDSLRPVLGTVVGYDRDHVARIAGTAFIVAAEAKFALAVTARHVLAEGVCRHQRPHPGRASSALFQHARNYEPSLEPHAFKVFVLGASNAIALNASFASYNNDSDLASLLLLPQQGETLVERLSIPFDLEDPPLGAVVHLVSQGDLQANEIRPPLRNDGEGQELSLFRRLSIRRGVVTGIHPNGYRHYRWPCFTTSIPATAGMSGGFVYLPRDGVTIAACGVVCADSSTQESHASLQACGESIIGSVWPAMGLRIPLTAPHRAEEPTLSLFDAIRTGRLPRPMGRFERMRYSETGESALVIRDP